MPSANSTIPDHAAGEPQPYGVIFCGEPGIFSTWIVTPGGEMMSREVVERLGQLAVRAGAADYRTFRLQGADVSTARMAGEREHGEFTSPDMAERYAALLLHARGVPPSCPRIDSSGRDSTA